MTEREINYLGALLHDIGKFAWRAQPFKAGDDHESLGERFIREHLGKCKLLKPYIEKIIKAAKREVGKIWIADVISSQERQKELSTETRRPIMSIFNRINIGKAKTPETVFFYNPEPLSSQITFPENSGKSFNDFYIDENEIISKHNTSWNNFINEIENLREISDFKVFVNVFYSLLEKYTSKICSAGYKSFPDISLFDHSRIVCALSVCYEETDNKEKECLLVLGDISGIQNYIYRDIQMKENAAKKLRGRSLFINLLSETISNYILNQLNLYFPNVIYNGGGHFILLVPNNKDNRDKINKLEKKINESLFEKFGGALQLVLSYSTFSASELITDFGNCYRGLTDVSIINKNKKSYSILEEKFLKTINIIEYLNSQNLLEKKEEDLGQALPNSQYILEVQLKDEKIDLLGLDNICYLDFLEFRTIWILPSENGNFDEIKGVLKDLEKYSINILFIHKLNNTEFTSIQKDLCNFKLPLACKFKFVGSYIPKENNRPMSFEEIAKIDSKDYPLIGVARMDVDSLGAIFAFGLRENDEDEKKYSISRIATLSRELNHFFCGHINTIAEAHKVYIAYSGGDDIFVVGSWLKVLNFVQDVREQFRKFVCGNENLSISCGIIITKPNFPIAKSAIIAGELESKAKKADEKNKDHISIFETEVKWKDLRELRGIADKLLKIVKSERSSENEKFPRSFIHTVLAMTRRCFDEKGKLKPKEVQKVVTRLHYLFARRGVNAKEIEEKKKGFKTTLAEYLLKSENKENFYKNFIIPASIVLYKTRN